MKLITLPHKVCPYSCMINGMEDLYENKTGIRLPDYLLLFISGLLGFVYIKNKNAPTPRMVFWGSNLAKYQYGTLAEIVGFQWQMVSNRSFSFTLKRAKEYVDQDIAPLLGVLDMYHLPYYEKFYHKIHVPIHYVLMLGYDEEQKAVLVLDCDRPDVQEVSYNDLKQASLGEAWFGAGKNYRNVILLAIGTGIAAGAVGGDELRASDCNLRYPRQPRGGRLESDRLAPFAGR